MEYVVIQIALELTDMERPLYERYGFIKMEDEIEITRYLMREGKNDSAIVLKFNGKKRADKKWRGIDEYKILYGHY